MDAKQIAAKHRTPRACRMLRDLAYVDGTQYDGRWPFLQEADDAPPLLERAPCIVDPIVANAIRSHADFVLGEGRWPAIRPRAGALPEDVEATVAEAIQSIDHTIRAPVVAREAFEDALAVGTAVAIVCARDRQVEVETVLAAWCTAKRDRQRRVTELEIRYPFVETYFDDHAGAYVDRCMLYRRVIDARRDVVFEPQPAPPDGSEPRTWVELDAVEHGLGRCPVVWYAALAKHRTVADVDGHPLHEHSHDEIDAYNFALSQRHRAALMCGDPMRWEAGVDDKRPPGGFGRDAMTAVELTQDGRGPLPKGTFRFAGGRSMGQPRRVGAGAIWSSPDPNYKVGMLTLPGDALEAIDKHARDLKAKLHEAFGIVDLDIENAKIATDMSGKAQAIARQRQVDRDNAYRQDFGDNFLVPLFRLALFVAAHVGAVNHGGVDVDRLPLDLAWGPYFASTAADQKAIVELCDAAIAAKLITRRIGIEKLKAEGVFPIDSADAVASEPTLEDALQVAALSPGSETFERIYRLRLLLSLLGEVDDKDAKAIESEIEAHAEHSAELREAMTDVLGANRAEGGEPDADDRGAESEDDAAGGRGGGAGGRFGAPGSGDAGAGHSGGA